MGDKPLRHSRLVQMARRATWIAEQARGVDHGAVLIGVAGSVQLWGERRQPGDTARELNGSLLQLLLVVVGRRLLDLRFNLRLPAPLTMVMFSFSINAAPAISTSTETISGPPSTYC
jgi:hypothetical protein